MSSLYLRIWLTVVSVLGAFALVSGWFVQRHLESERERIESVATERLGAWAELVQRSLPAADAAPEQQAAALREWSLRLRMPMALDDASGQRIGAADAYLNREADTGRRGAPVRLDDGRTLWVMRPGAGRGFRRGGARRRGRRRALARCTRGRGPPRSPSNRWPALLLPPRMAARCRLACAVGVAVRGRGRRCLPGGAQPDAAPRGAAGRCRALRRRIAWPACRRSRDATRWPRWRAASTSRPSASRRCCGSHQQPAGQCQPRAALAAGAFEDGGGDAAAGRWRAARHAAP